MVKRKVGIREKGEAKKRTLERGSWPKNVTVFFYH